VIITSTPRHPGSEFHWLRDSKTFYYVAARSR
jgi:hypothetical protein